jgi:hypothetical protein
MRTLSVFILVLASISTGCCTIVHLGFTQKVNVNSTPPGASVVIDHEYRGKTPVVVYLKRHDVHEVHIDMEGYQHYETSTTRGLSYWIYGNLVFGGVTGFLTDAMSGSMFNVEPRAIHAELVRQ